jgi:hypothetical protein
MTRQLDFRDHRRELGDNRFVYAVVSRRAGGLSIGLNLNPDKVCNFDCPYCQVDRSPKGLENLTRGVDVARLSAELDGLLAWVKDGSLWSRAPFTPRRQSTARSLTSHSLEMASRRHPERSPRLPQQRGRRGTSMA